MNDKPRYPEHPDARTDRLADQLNVKTALGELSSEEAQQYWRDNILKKATCPICGGAGLTHLVLQGHREDEGIDQLTFGLPIIVPGRNDLVSVGALQYASCLRCGYLAAFLDLAIKGLYVRSQGHE